MQSTDTVAGEKNWVWQAHRKVNVVILERVMMRSRRNMYAKYQTVIERANLNKKTRKVIVEANALIERERFPRLLGKIIRPVAQSLVASAAAHPRLSTVIILCSAESVMEYDRHHGNEHATDCHVV